MHEHHTTTFTILATLVLLTTACFDSDELPGDVVADASETSSDTDATSTTDEDASHQLDVELFVDGKDFPDSVLSARAVELTADVSGELPAVSIDFIVDDELVTTSFEQPYAYQLVLADASDNGVRVLTARVTDEDGNVAEDTVLLPVGMPEHGTAIWDYRVAQVPAVGLSVGEEDRSLLATQDSLFIIDAAGLELDAYDFSTPTYTTATTPEGGIITLGSDDDALVYHRFDATGALERYDALEGAAPSAFLVMGARYGDNDRLIVTWAYECGLFPCQELASVNHINSLSADWVLGLEREGENPLAHVPALDVGPSGDIYVSTGFFHDATSYHRQLRRIGQGADSTWISEELTLADSFVRDVITTPTSIHAGGRLDGRAAIVEYSFEGERVAVRYVEGEEVSKLVEVDDDLVYASRVEQAGESAVGLGRLSTTSGVQWSVLSERAEGEQESVRALARDSLGHVHVLSVLSSGEARLQRVAL